MRHLLPLLLAPLVVAGCLNLARGPQTPASLDPVTLRAPAPIVYDEALALAFDAGYEIVYSSEEEGLIEMDVLLRQVIGEDRIRRLAVLVRPADAGSRVHARYSSFHRGGGSYAARDEDREAALAFVGALEQRLLQRAGR